MTSFPNTFRTTGPVGTSLANQIDIYVRADTKIALNERLSLEHYDLETGVNDVTLPGGQGRHKAGYVGVFALDTAANIQAITGAGIGAIGLATDTGAFYRNGSSGWVIVQFGTGTLYANTAEVTAGVLEEKAVDPLHLQERLDDVIWSPTFKTINAHASENIMQSTTSTAGISAVTYDLTEFTGAADLDLTLATRLLVDVILTAETNSGFREYVFFNATTDTISEYAVCGGECGQNEQGIHITSRMEIPLNRNDTEVTLEVDATMSDNTDLLYKWTIAGVIQKEFGI